MWTETQSFPDWRHVAFALPVTDLRVSRQLFWVVGQARHGRGEAIQLVNRFRAVTAAVGLLMALASCGAGTPAGRGRTKRPVRAPQPSGDRYSGSESPGGRTLPS